ncbi:MAG: DUF2142 domain-containing protein [Lachnospiraceae bacterium]|nr:DUF2142 domain-containing protein [Lachnospiraceae bacterium]
MKNGKFRKKHRNFSVDKKRGILAVLLLVVAVEIFIFHYMNPMMQSETTNSVPNQTVVGPVFQNTELKQRFALPEKNMELQSIQIMFATYNDTVVTKGFHFSLYDATNDNLLYEEDILRERLSDNQYVAISLDNINTSENQFYYVLRGADEFDGIAIPATVWTTDSDGLSESLEINGEENGKVINTIYTYQYEENSGYFILVLEVLLVMLSVFITIPEIKNCSVRVAASVICFVANAALVVSLGRQLAGLGSGAGLSVWVVATMLIMMIAMVAYATYGRISLYGHQGKKDFLRRFLVIYLPIAMFAIIYVNASYINPNEFIRYQWSEGTVVTEVTGYTENDGVYQYNSEQECFLTLVGGEDVNKVLLELNTVADRDISISYRAISENSISSEKKEVIWKKGMLSVALDVAQKDCAGIQVSIPADFSMDTLYYINEREKETSRAVMHLEAQMILIAIVLGFLVSSFGKCFSGMCLERLGQTKHWLGNNRKKILRFFVILFVFSLTGLGVLKILVVGNICDWTVKSVLYCILTSWLIATFAFLNKYFVYKTEIIGFIIILLAGSLFALIAPGNVGLSWDDQDHYNFSCRASNVGNDFRAYSDSIVCEYVFIPRGNYDRGMQESSYVIIDTLEQEGCYEPNQDVAWNNLTSWVPYIPSALGVAVARGLGMPYHMQLISGRWMNVWLLAILCFFAMRKLGNGKIVVLLVALIPTNIFIASNYTYDTWLTGWSILGISLFMGELQERDKKITVKTMIAIAGSMCLAVIPKMVYFPLTLMVLFMPKHKFKSKEQQYGYYAMIIGVMLLPFLVLYFSTFGSSGGASSLGDGDKRGGEAVSANTQLEYIKNNFGAFAKTIYTFLLGYLNPLENGGGYLTSFAYVAEKSRVSYRVVLCVMVAGSFFHHEDDARIPWWYRAGTLCVYVGVGIICSVSMYIMFTPVGATWVAGCQSRYLLPAVFPTVYVLTRIPVQWKLKTFMDEKGLTRLVDMILVGIMLYAGMIAVWDAYVMRY